MGVEKNVQAEGTVDTAYEVRNVLANWFTIEFGSCLSIALPAHL